MKRKNSEEENILSGSENPKDPKRTRTDFSPIQDKNKEQEKTRLDNLIIIRKQTSEFIELAVTRLIEILENKTLKEDVKFFLEKQKVLIEQNGELGKLTLNNFFISSIDQCIIDNNKVIASFFEEIEQNKKYNEFDKKTVKNILVGLAESYERWKETHTKQAIKKEAWLFLRPYVEQQIIDADENIQTVKNELFGYVAKQVKEYYKGVNFIQQKENFHPSCFISYAWPDMVTHPEEWWTQKFIYQFAQDLRMLGINAKMDLINSRYGNDSINYMLEGVKKDDFIIVIGTQSLYKKYSNKDRFDHAIRTELNAIINRIDDDRKNKQGNHVFFLTLSGDMKESVPELFHKYSVIESFHDSSYLKTIKETVGQMYRQNEKDDLRKDNYEKRWQEANKANKSFKLLSDGINIDSVKSYYKQFSEAKQQHQQEKEEFDRNIVSNLIKKK